MSRPVRLVALCIGRAGDEQQRWHPAHVQALLRPSPVGVPPAQRLTLGDFWADCTDGELDLTPSVALDWVEPPAAQAVWSALNSPEIVGAADAVLLDTVQQLVDACLPSLSPSDLSALHTAHGVVILTTAESPLYWTQPISLGADRRTFAAYLSTGCSHTSMAHEIGHLLELQHSFGLPTVGVGTEYGNPYCIMSARRFGGRSRQVMHRVEDPPLLPDAPLWDQVGPRLARASWWASRHSRWSPATGRPSPSAVARVQVVELGEERVGARVTRTAGSDPGLLVIPIEAGRRWLTAEVRGPSPASHGADWDGALALDRVARPGRAADQDTADAAGVVVHEVVDGRAIYRDTIALPPAGDTDTLLLTEGQQVAIQVIDWADGVATLLLGAGPAVPMAWAHIARTVGADDGVRFHVQLHSQGYERPVFSWHVAGQTVVSRHQLGDRAVTRMTALPGYEPSDLGIVVAEVRWDQLTLDVTLWHGSPGPVTVSVDVAESAGAGSAAVSARRAREEAMPEAAPGALQRITRAVYPGPDDEPGLDVICTAT